MSKNISCTLSNYLFACSEFTISYLSRDDEGDDVFLALLSDWDLDAAIFCASDPCLRLRIDAKPFEGPGMDHRFNCWLDSDWPVQMHKFIPCCS